MAFMWHADASMPFMACGIIDYTEVDWGKGCNKQVCEFFLHGLQGPNLDESMEKAGLYVLR